MDWRRLCNFLAISGIAALSAASAACSGGDDPEPSKPSGTQASGALIGTFEIELAASSETTSVLGKVASGPTPATIVWEELAASGDCRLRKPVVPFCDPGCGSDACVADGMCLSYPVGLDAGAVTLRGLAAVDGSPEFTLIEIASTYQAPPAVPLVFPPFTAGDPVELEAAGAEVGAFSLQATAIAPLVVTSGDPAIVSGESITLTWESASDPQSSRVLVKLDISHHGGTKGVVECDTADDGALAIEATLLEQLVDLGVAGFPSVIVSRRAVGSTAITEGRLELVIVSQEEFLVDVPGVVSCTSDDECPSGTCQTDLKCGP
jgi:hypothetical protein